MPRVKYHAAPIPTEALAAAAGAHWASHAGTCATCRSYRLALATSGG